MIKPMRLGCVFYLSFAVWAYAQQPAPPAPDQPSATSSSAEGRVHLNIAVTDKSGRLVSGLELQDFLLKDNNVPQKIVSFRAVDSPTADPSAQVILLLDAVNLDAPAAKRTRDEMAKFLRKNGGHLAHPVSVFLLTDEGAKVLLQASVDGNALAAQLEQTESGFRALGRGAGQYGEIERFESSVKWMAKIANAESKRPGRKLLLWTGPGWPLLDRPDMNPRDKGQQQMFNEIVNLSTTLREAQITVYSVAVGEPEPGTYLYEGFLKPVKTVGKANPSELGLKVLAVQTGGRVMSPNNDLAGQISRCVQDIDSYYAITFDPPRADGANQYHDLKVEIGKPGLTARTNTGYYNQP